MKTSEKLNRMADRIEFEKDFKLNMGNWYVKTDCGTQACALGSACMIPEFKEMGLTLEIDPPFRGRSQGTPTFNYRRGVMAGKEFFGITTEEAVFLFDTGTAMRRSRKEEATVIRNMAKRYAKKGN